MLAGTHRRAQTPPSVGRARLSDLLVLLGLSGFAFSQPMLSLLGDNPLVFTFYDVEGVGLVLFTIGLTLVPPIALWLVGLGATAINRSIGRWVHIAAVGVLAWLAAVQIVKALDVERPLFVAILGGVAAGSFTFLYDRVESVRTWTRLTAVLPFLALALFLLASPSGDLLRSPDVAAANSGARDLPPIVFIVLDEFPTKSVLDEHDEIDAVRFPNLAALGDDATWYRRYSSLAASTQYAVPSLLTGGEPKLGQPLWTNYPNSLFTLLAPDYDLTAFETATELCGLDTCTEGPPGGGDDPSPRYGDLWAITSDLYRERVSIQPNKGERLDTFQEEIQPDVRGSGPRDAQPSAPLRQGGWGTDTLLNRPKRFNQFLDSLQPREGRPILSFLHLMLPHQPWRFHANGEPYDVLFGFKETYPFAPANDGGEWLSALTEQRHLLQAQYTDALLGQITEKLKDTGIYNEALVVVVADHGVTFEPGVQARRLNADSLDGIDGLAYTPLLIKAPGQAKGTIDDSSMMSVDVLPTVADMIGLELPFQVQGEAAGSDDLEARGDERVYFDLEGAMGGNARLRSVRTFDGEEHFPSATDRWIGPMADGAGSLDGLYARLDLPEVLGRPLDDLDPEPGGRAEIAGLNELREPAPDGPPVGLIVGHVTTAAPPDGIVLLAANGTVVGASPLFRYAKADNSFAILLPPGVVEPEGNDIRAVMLTDGGAIELELPD
jgi:Sulfatase